MINMSVDLHYDQWKIFKKNWGFWKYFILLCKFYKRIHTLILFHSLNYERSLDLKELQSCSHTLNWYYWRWRFWNNCSKQRMKTWSVFWWYVWDLGLTEGCLSIIHMRFILGLLHIFYMLWEFLSASQGTKFTFSSLAILTHSTLKLLTEYRTDMLLHAFTSLRTCIN